MDNKENPEIDSSGSLITKLTKSGKIKKKRKLKAYYCPYCNDPKSKLTENQLNLIEIGMVIECVVCGKSIKSNDYELY